MGDLTIKYKTVQKDAICTMCGDVPAEVVIFDPNKFPANEEDDTWDVCKDCRDFINKGMDMSHATMIKSLFGEEIDVKELAKKYVFGDKDEVIDVNYQEEK
jgi:hypothetical protein